MNGVSPDTAVLIIGHVTPPADATGGKIAASIKGDRSNRAAAISPMSGS